MTPSINTVTMEVEAHSRDEALKTAQQVNENFCNGAKTYIHTEYLSWNEWLVILADNIDDAIQAKEKYFADYED